MSKATETVNEEAIELAASTLTGDIRDFMLDRVKNFRKPWPAMSEDEQRDQIIAAKDAAERLVRKVVRIIAADGRKTITATLESVTIKDEVKGVFTLSKTDENRHELADSTRQAILIVVADAEAFTGEASPAEPTPDQGDLVANAESLANSNVKPLK